MNYIYLHGFLSGPDSTKGKYLEKVFNQEGHKLYRPDLNGTDFSQMTISSQLEIINDLLESISGEVVLLGSSLGVPGLSKPLPNVPANYDKLLVKNDFAWAAKNRDRILAEWSKRYESKAAPK